MAKQLNVNLSFNADTSQAKAQIQALSKSLQDIAKMPGNASNLFDDTQIKKASQAALELQQHLSKAVNVDTGKLDLSRFSSSLKTSNKDLSIYCNTLLSTGEKGQQAFLQLAQAIATADTPVTRVNKKLAEMGTTLKNTARWQISSSILHGFMGAVQSAYGYAQDLNESLNEIRIVTGQNIEQMSKFAAEANRAAKALSTTTTEYTDASLIYYQQGLSDSEVAKRTEVTIKMANAAGQSAQIVSDQLTAIWNNFYDGSKSLEYYADVMTALGAATASSTDEIAGGLEKFAAIGETIGLSYEYAASALATITSNTRQSEEVVGTALKTIFARIQGLNLGETLDDGTTLNKYSKALQSVGISIFDQAGELKNMDNILNEMADKWDTLSKAQQVALAQTVAGTRQYTQLVALMDNWDNGDNDSMTANLNTAYGSSGALQEQADIYAESWEAAQDRVTAAAEHIYSSLINDEFFIDLLNGFEKVLETVGGLIDGLGGLKGVVGIVGSVFLTNFAKKMPEALDNLRQNVMVFTGQANKEMQKVQSDLSMSIKTAQATPGASTEYKIQLEGIAQVNAMKQKLTLASKNLTSQEIAEYEAKIDNVKAMYDEVAALSAKAEALKKVEDATAKQAMKTASKGADSLFGDYWAAQDNRNRAEERATAPGASAEETTAYVQEMAKAQTQVDALEQKIKSLAEATQLTEHEMRALMAGPEVTKGNAQATENAAKGQEKIKKAIAETTAELQKQSKQRSYLNNLSVSIKSQAASWRDVSKEVSIAVKEHKNLKGAEKTTSVLKEKMTQYLEVLKRVAKESDLALDDDYIEKMAQSINNMDTSNIEDVTVEFDDFATAISTDASNGVKQLDGSISMLSEKMGALQFDSGEIDGLEQKADEAAEGLQNLNDSMDNIQGTAEETFDGEFKPSVALTEFASVAMSVSSLVTSMQSAMSVFADEGATGFEQIGAAISVLMPLMSTFNALQTLSTTLSKSSYVAKLFEVLGYKMMTTESGKMVLAKVTETGAVVANTAAWYANPIMWIALVVIGAVAAVALLVSWIVKLTKSLSSDTLEKRLKAAEAATKGMAQAAEEAEDKYQNLLDTINSYDSAVEKLKDLEAGTNEFTLALLEANKYAQELIEKYNLMPDYWFLDENGVIQFKTGVLDNAVENERENVEATNAMLMGAKIEKNTAQRDVDAGNMGEYGSVKFGDIEVGNEYVEEFYRKILESGYKSVADFNKNATEEEKKNLVSQGVYGEEWSNYDDIGYDRQQYVDSILANFSEGMAGYEKLWVDNEIKNQGLVKTNVVNSLSDEKAYQDTDYKNYVLDQILSDANWEEAKTEALSEYDNLTEDEIKTAFQNALGDSYIYEDGKVYSKDEKGEKGDEVEGLSNLTTDQMKDYMVNADAIQIIEEEGIQLATAINSITANLSDEEKAFADAILNGNFAALSKEDIAKLQDMSPEEIKNMFPFLSMLEGFGVDIDALLGDLTTKITEWEPPKIDLSTATEEFNEVQKIISGLELGDTISEEDYLKLGEGAENYFTRMADGTYKLIGDAEEFYNLISQQQTDKLLNDATWAQEYGNNLVKDRDKADVALGGMSLSDIGKSYYNASNNTATYSKIDNQIDFAQEMGTMTQEDADSYRAKLLENGGSGLNANEIERITTAAQEGVLAYQDLTNEIDNNKAAIENSISAIFNSATSLEDLNNKQLQVNATLGENSYSQETYANGLMVLAVKYDHCTEEIQKYKAALASGIGVEEAQEVLETSIKIGEEAESYGLVAEQVETVADAFRDMADAGVEGMEALQDDEEAVKDASVRYMQLNEAIEDIYDNYEDYVDVLKDVRNATSKADRAMATNTDSAKKLKVSMAGLLGTTEDMIDADLLAAIDPKDFEAAANGNADAIERIREKFIELQYDGLNAIEPLGFGLKELMDELNQFNDGAYIDLDNTEFLNELIQAAVNAGQTAAEIEAMLSGFGIDADVTPFTENLLAATQAAQTAGENIANATSFTTEVETADVDASSEIDVPQYTEVATAQTRVMGYNQVPMSNGFTAAIFPSVITTTQKRVDTSTVPQTVEKTETAVGQSVTTGNGTTSKGGVIVKNAHKATAASKTPSVSNTSRAPVGSSGGGGGGSTPKAPDKIEKRDTASQADVVERYREINDSIDNVTDALTRAERAAARLWGKDKLAAMREENKILEEQRDLILEKAEEAEKYAKEDAKNLRKVAKDIGVSVVINQDTGDITNIEDVEETLYNRLAAAEAEYNAKVEAYNKYVASIGDSPTQAQVDQAETMKDALDAYEEDIIEKIEKDIETWEEAEQQFQDSIETWEDAGLEAEEILDQIMQNNYDIIMEGLEIPLSLNEEDLRLIELKLSQLEDDVYKMAEAVALTSSQFGEYRDNLRLADEALAELNRAHEAGEITDAAYQEGLGEIRDKYYENIEALIELDNTMMEYYSNTIDMANEELSKYTDQIEHQTSVLEHYSSLIELLGKSSDYKMMGKVLEGQVKTTKDAMTVSKQWYETQRANADSLAAEYAAAQARGASDEELKLIKANWDAAEASANEAQDKMLSDAEAWAEALRAVLENKLADLGQTLENALTGGTSFDTINTQMERAQSLQEEYLTTTNQIYETNKLMRTAQQEIDKTTNSVAKKRLKAYIQETEQLQNQSKLSKYELEIQQAKYDLILAEMALEEAQDAKSTVRLQRDSEGNFGYVYTADQNKLTEAQQQLADAQNSLYNIGLEGANDYAQKYQQTMQEMYDTFADLQQQKLDGAFETEEEYHRAMEEAKAYYYQKLQDYSSLYSVAITADSRVVADAWSTDFSNMIYNTSEWMSAVDEYVADVQLAFKEWSDAVHNSQTGIVAIVGGDVTKVGQTVEEVTTKSGELATTTTEKVIPALEKELGAVQNMTGAYAAMRKEIQEVITEYTNMINRINNSQTSEWNSSKDKENNTNNNNSSNNTSKNDNTENSSNNSNNSGESNKGSGGNSQTKSDSYRYGTVEFRGNGANRIWIDEAGKQYSWSSSQGKALQEAFNKAYGRNGGYKGDYWIGWTDAGGKLKADILREKDGLETGGYTGEWSGSYGKLALLHQKELVLNSQDTENLLTSMEVLNKIIEMIDLQSMSSQLGGMLNSPSLGVHSNEVLEQNVHIEASFPGVQDRNEIEEAFNMLINQASQYANRK